MGIRYSIARWVLAHQRLSFAAIAAVTVFFAFGLKNVQLETIFSDLLPRGHEFAETYRAHPNFGSPLTMSVMIQRTDGGDIYNTETLQKIWDFTRDIDLAPAVDHDQVVSITTEKARYAEATPYGIDMRPVMGDSVPQTPEAIEEFRSRVERSPVVRNFFMSQDATAALVTAAFHEHRLNYRETFEYVQALVEAARDENHAVYLAGQPAETGWIHHYQHQMIWIFAVTLGALILALVVYMRNIAGVVTPLAAAGLSAIWGFGFAGWVGQAIEPLLLLVPLLLVARAFSHCVQFTERFYEINEHVPDRKKAAEITMRVMMGPGALGIITDAAAIFFIAIAPIPAMERFAMFCGFWALMLLPTVLIFAPLFLTLLPTPKNLDKIVAKDKAGGAVGLNARVKSALRVLVSVTYERPARATAVILVVLSSFALWQTLTIDIGNPVEGSPFLWEDDEFNTAVRKINDNFPGINTLEIIFEARPGADGNGDEEGMRIARTSEAIHNMLRLQRLVESYDVPPRATLSFGDYLMEANRLFSGGNPMWMPLDAEDRAVNAAVTAVLMGSSPLAFSHLVDFELRNATVSLWYRDNIQETVDRALAQAREAVQQLGSEHDMFTIRLGSGTIALQQAMNDTVVQYYWFILGLLALSIVVMASWAYRSLVAGVVLLVPVVLSKLFLTMTMNLMGIGLDINSLLVAAIGVGVGIDYGIYLLSRMCEEWRRQGEDPKLTIVAAATTTGRAILFTATIMLIGILPWYFLSGLKFLADMGLLLALIMVINMVMALIVIPVLVWFFRPAFLGMEDHFVSEHVDIDVLLQEGRSAGAQA